ncbi:hypothetical protein ACJJTC_006368 [Scirpophaga incertulas]
MRFVRRHFEFNTINAIVRLYSLARKTHYEVLNLSRNCTGKEIKDAFIKLSKQFHPDKNKDAAAQGKFVQIVEAYNVLSKPRSRAKYDNMSTVPSSSYVYKTNTSYNMRRDQYSHNHNFYNSNYYDYQFRSQTHKSQSTSRNNATKVPNYIIILTCCGLALFGCMIQLIVIREMYVIHRHEANARSKTLGEELEKVRNAAQGNGNEMQTRLLLEKIVTAANPTVATASLGKSLASEKKDTETLLKEIGMADVLIGDFNGMFQRSIESSRNYTVRSWCVH